jgi:hypothetical protein
MALLSSNALCHRFNGSLSLAVSNLYATCDNVRHSGPKEPGGERALPMARGHGPAPELSVAFLRIIKASLVLRPFIYAPAHRPAAVELRAAAIYVRVSEGLFPVIFPVIVGALVWGDLKKIDTPGGRCTIGRTRDCLVGGTSQGGGEGGDGVDGLHAQSGSVRLLRQSLQGKGGAYACRCLPFLAGIATA